jgi:glycosyltransferase involved in cell wall biosynthesis
MVASPSEGEPRDHSTTPTQRDTLRVLHVINGEHYSGAERVQDLLAAHLPEFGYEVAFGCVKPDRFDAQRQAKDAALYDLPMRSRFDFRVAGRLKRLIRDEGFQIVHAHTPRSALVGRIAAWSAKVPMVYHVHSPTSRDTTHLWRNWVNQAIERTSLFDVAALITVSESLGRHMRLQGYSEDRISVVQNGVPAPTRLRSETPPRDRWQIGSVALFRPRKGLEVLLQALAILKKHGAQVRLRAVGPFETAEYEGEILERVRQLELGDQIEWIGFTQDVTSELTEMDLFVLPSLFGEGLPMVVLEAMAAGVPVVGTHVEGVPEAIDDGINGLTAEPGDPDDLARRILQVVEGKLDWSTLRRNAIEAHQQRFSARRMAAGVAAVYDRILAQAN